jgi:Txe/YoeB family toxin of Txe-Axe toxin-antitoxin module
MKINIHLLRSVYSFSLIKVQTDLKLWSNKNRVKRTPFLSIQKPERLPRSSLATLRIS